MNVHSPSSSAPPSLHDRDLVSLSSLSPETKRVLAIAGIVIAGFFAVGIWCVKEQYDEGEEWAKRRRNIPSAVSRVSDTTRNEILSIVHAVTNGVESPYNQARLREEALFLLMKGGKNSPTKAD